MRKVLLFQDFSSCCFFFCGEDLGLVWPTRNSTRLENFSWGFLPDSLSNPNIGDSSTQLCWWSIKINPCVLMIHPEEHSLVSLGGSSGGLGGHHCLDLGFRGLLPASVFFPSWFSGSWLKNGKTKGVLIPALIMPDFSWCRFSLFSNIYLDSCSWLSKRDSLVPSLYETSGFLSFFFSFLPFLPFFPTFLLPSLPTTFPSYFQSVLICPFFRNLPFIHFLFLIFITLPLLSLLML